MAKPILILGTIILANVAFGAWVLSGDPSPGLIVAGIFNLGAATYAAVVLGKILADR